ncbi:MAG: site-specific integrase [Bacteroidales bacterium]|nr:site-specific integrase [Candidatus Scybalocola fimicaballi]
MGKHCTSVYFVIKKSRKDKAGLSPIECYINVNAERVMFYTGKKVKESDWDAKKQLVKGKSEEAGLINDFHYQLRNKIFAKEVELIGRGFVISAQLLKDAVNDNVDELKQKTLMNVFDEYQNIRKGMVGKTIVKDTFYHNELTGRYLRDFIKTKLNRDDIMLGEVKLNFIHGFHSYLLSGRNLCQNGTIKHLKFLKFLMNYSVANGYITVNPIAIYKVEKQPVEIDFLDELELRKIINFDSPLARFMRTKDAFLFGCYTGLSYIDIKTLRKEHFETDSEGRIWIKKKRVKTGVLSCIPLLPMAKIILEKYKHWEGEEVMPIQDCADVNENLKDIALLCGINKHVTFHTSRHTFASTVTLANNISLEVVAKMMGHTNTRMTSHYAKLIDKTIAEQMDKLMDEEY